MPRKKKTETATVVEVKPEVVTEAVKENVQKAQAEKPAKSLPQRKHLQASFICSALAVHISVIQIFMIFGFITITVYMILLMSKKLKVIES